MVWKVVTWPSRMNTQKSLSSCLFNFSSPKCRLTSYNIELHVSKVVKYLLVTDSTGRPWLHTYTALTIHTQRICNSLLTRYHYHNTDYCFHNNDHKSASYNAIQWHRNNFNIIDGCQFFVIFCMIKFHNDLYTSSKMLTSALLKTLQASTDGNKLSWNEGGLTSNSTQYRPKSFRRQLTKPISWLVQTLSLLNQSLDRYWQS